MTTGVLMMRGRVRRAMDGAGVRLRTSHGEAEHQREDHPEEPHHTILSFQRPRRNSTTLANASVEKAIVTAQATPRGPISKWRASTKASGISHSQKQNKFSHVGVQVSPAPLKEFVRTMPYA